MTGAAVRQIRAMLAETPGPAGRGLRISVGKGGCAGLQYEMEFDQPREHDFLHSDGDVAVLVDAASAPFLDGVSVDYVDGLTGAGFRIENPKALRSCGCGSSFEVGRDA